MNKVSPSLGTLLLATLTGCSGFQTQPYVEPPTSAASAKVRIISNSDVFGDPMTGQCAPKVRHEMVSAGRFSSGKPLQNYPQYPVSPPKLGMPERTSAPLLSLTPTIRMAEGRYEEVVAEYRVPANVPFQFATFGAGAGTSLGRGVYCAADARVYTLEAGRDYEVTIGMGAIGQGDNVRPVCRFDVRKLVAFGEGQGRLTVPFPLVGVVAPERVCD
ncbi:hypothetical protein KSS94_14235 [Pseudomonas fakonensis]|uniref:Lipoprotein n=1 Tax=Pseudomonas fakonensis TaxID=2842355 RepID=A0ABX8MZB1_9PSED|nr:hypothetical protein [Pseudomonas fakonensis]QXH49120.1 hypothetical protein KSS94_14235 [Pseudomonas fakonensis]